MPGTRAGRGNLPGLTSIEAALSGEAGLWPGARIKRLVLVFHADWRGCFSLLGCVFLLTKMVSSLFSTGWSYFVSSHHKMMKVL